MSFPVWQFPETGESAIQVGDLEFGRFIYDADYLAAGGAALDPDELRFTGKRSGIAITSPLRDRLPGIIADAGPDSWGRSVLAQDLGYVPDALQTLVNAATDGAGNLAVGDLTAKPPCPPLSLTDLADAIARRQDALARAETGLAIRGVSSNLDQILSPDTALGGAKPKANLMHEGTEWIAKFPERGDPECLPFFEATALRVAALCGIESAEVQVHSLAKNRHVLLVKRFDRIASSAKVAQGGRLGFASGLTVMKPQALKFDSQSSYLGFAHNLGRWLGRAHHENARAALWQRLAYNALVGNIDDHARNHALIREQGQWRLSPVFDIVPTWRMPMPDKDYDSLPINLSLPYFRNAEGILSSHVSARQLVCAAPGFGLAAQTAHAQLISMAETIEQHWLDTLAQLDAPAYAEPPMCATLAWVKHLRQQAEALTGADMSPPTKSRGWRR